MISKWAKQRDVVEESVDLMIFMASKEVQLVNFREAGADPFRVSIVDSDEFATKATRQTLLESNKYRLQDGAFYSKATYWYPWYYRGVRPFITDIFNNKVSLKEGLAQMTEEGNKALAGDFGPGR